MYHLRRVPALRSVLARDAELPGSEQPVDVGHRAPADQGEGPARGGVQLAQQPFEIFVDPNLVRPVGKIHERSVDVQEERSRRRELRHRSHRESRVPLARPRESGAAPD
jgi:hypothetical protein